MDRLKKRAELRSLLDKLGAHDVQIDRYNDRKIYVYNDSTEEEVGSAIVLSDGMCYATIHLDNGGFSNHYMPLKHFLEIYYY